MSFDDYSNLANTGYKGGTTQQKAPEDEFFHSCYVAGKNRTNHINVKEISGELQIRGVEYNLEKVHMIITHTKEILANIKTEKAKDTTLCFSFKDGEPPWHGTSKLGDGSNRVCPQTSPERAVNDFCCNCKTQILVAGIYCKESGEPILNDEKKPIFIFIRGKGMRFSGVSEYLNDLYNEDLDPVFEPVTEESAQFEKSVVNNKRFVTEITIGEETSSFGNDVYIFKLNRGLKLPKETVLSILKLSKQTVDKFIEKFDWSKKQQTTGYGSSSTPDGVLTTDNENGKSTEEKASEAGVEEPTAKPFSFDDVSF